MERLAIVAALIFVGLSPVHAEPHKDAGLFKGPVSELRIPAEGIGPEWSGPTGFVLDDVNDISMQPAELQQISKTLQEQLGPLGVAGVADFTYRKKSKDPGFILPAQVTVKVFVFKSAEACREWWDAKYRFAGWEKHYTIVPDSGHKAVDSKENETQQKRVMAIGNVLLTSSLVYGKNDHLKILDLFAHKVEEVVKK